MAGAHLSAWLLLGSSDRFALHLPRSDVLLSSVGLSVSVESRHLHYRLPALGALHNRFSAVSENTLPAFGSSAEQFVTLIEEVQTSCSVQLKQPLNGFNFGPAQCFHIGRLQ